MPLSTYQKWAIYVLMGIHDEPNAAPPTKSQLRIAAENYLGDHTGRTYAGSLGQAARDLVDDSILDTDFNDAQNVPLKGFEGTSLRQVFAFGPQYTGTPPCPAGPAQSRIYNRISQIQ
ncbi:MAG TPA: hypothetical protein VN924_03950 [Bryobacteraceae bacterium]|jgi:hypothetical protein|nr:hypothetical protein [Bryobacteraceae bacterium]